MTLLDVAKTALKKDFCILTLTKTDFSLSYLGNPDKVIFIKIAETRRSTILQPFQSLSPLYDFLCRQPAATEAQIHISSPLRVIISIGQSRAGSRISTAAARRAAYWRV